MSKENKINIELFNLEETKKYFYEKKIKNVILFSQARSGSTFVSNVLAEELGFTKNFFSEQFFISQHSTYIKRFVKKHDNFFINTNEFVYRRTDLKKKNTLHIYLHRNYLDILESYEKARKLNNYLGWDEMYSKYRPFFPTLKHINPITLFNHKVWETQINHFEHGLTLSYESFNIHPKFLDHKIRLKKITTLKQINLDEGWEEYEKNIQFQKKNFSKKLNFNLIEKLYFKFRRLMESRKKNRKNY